MNMKIDGSSSPISNNPSFSPVFVNPQAILDVLNQIQAAMDTYSDLPAKPTSEQGLFAALEMKIIPSLCTKAIDLAYGTMYNPDNPPLNPVVNQFCQDMTSLSAAATDALPSLWSIVGSKETSTPISNDAANEFQKDWDAMEAALGDATNQLNNVAN